MNILIRPLTIEDAAISYKWRNDPEVWKFTGSRPSREITAEIERDWLKNSLGDKSKTRFAILVDGEYVGNVQLTDIILNKTAEFHIFIGDKSFWGKGVAKEATYQILQYAKEGLNLQSVFLDVNKENLPAIKSYKKNGFVIANETKDSIKMVCDIQNLKPPMVSVFCMVYNQEQYISQAIEGFLMQKATFNSVMVIGEDCSTDGSRNIILEYAKKYPGKFKLLLNDKNIGAHKNQEKVLKNCTGKYIAMCEGDDYWTDPLKLQKQVGFMEANPSIGACFTNAAVNNHINHTTYEYNSTYQLVEGVLDKRKLFNIGGGIYPTCTLVYRTHLVAIPEHIVEMAGDELLLFTLANNAEIAYLNFITATYNRWCNGAFSGISNNKKKLLMYRRKELKGYEKLLPLLINSNQILLKFRMKKVASHIIKKDKFSILNFNYLKLLGLKSFIKTLMG
ncbi:MAG: hypothetical protein CL524_06250 [Aequorivita sp.]|nr:hypothetical protein [Aequorivita sp.]MBF31801.1 hypothetical protein [Aequorivita sp.]